MSDPLYRKTAILVCLLSVSCCFASENTFSAAQSTAAAETDTGKALRRYLREEEVLGALQSSLKSPAEITILDFSHQPVPEGALTFPLSGLRTGQAGDGNPVYWRGAMSGAGEWPVPVWARATIRSRFRRVVATETIQRGNPVTARQLREDERVGVPVAGYAMSAEELLGRIPRRNVRPGELLRISEFALPFDVRRGDVVTVVVRSGGTRLTLSARAEADGYVRDLLPFRIAAGRGRFKAVLEARGLARVETPLR